jgi:hypothetical protein
MVLELMDSRNERVLIETERYRILGDLTLPRDGYRSRMTDFLNAAERDFIALTAVTITPLDGGEESNQEFIAVSRRHVVLAMPIDATDAGRRSDAVGHSSTAPPELDEPEDEAEREERTGSVAPPGRD